MQGFWQRFLGNPRVTLSLLWLAFIVAVAAAAPLLAPTSPFAIVSKPFSPPFGEFLLGTDSLGRSLLAGLIHGARTSLLIAIIATLAAVAFGTLIGSVAGFYGGIIDDVLMRLSEFFQTIPSFIFAIVLVAILAPSAYSLVIAIATVSWPPIARVVRGESERCAAVRGGPVHLQRCSHLGRQGCLAPPRQQTHECCDQRSRRDAGRQ